MAFCFRYDAKSGISHVSTIGFCHVALAAGSSFCLLIACPPPLCQFCQLAYSKYCVPKVKQPAMAHQDNMRFMSQYYYEAGNFVSVELHVVSFSEGLLSSYECKAI